MSSDEETFSLSFESIESYHASCCSADHSDDEQGLDCAEVIAELQTHSKQISEAHKAVENSHASLEKCVLEMREVVKKKEQDLKLLRTWPLQLADDARKWLELWESKFGKKLLNSQTSKLVDNAFIVESTGRTVNYCRQYIHVKRISHEEWRESTQEMCAIYESEIKRVQQEVGVLRNEATRWELCATKNELCVVELNDRVEQLRLELAQRRLQIEGLKAGYLTFRVNNVLIWNAQEDDDIE
ncbi:hypothetical protein M3Y97_00513700 [Aphelenchoides bicaudatus]|nr:hypothetical protein M3Y97_00513700 [Aphelenchoides bicaudatus]